MNLKHNFLYGIFTLQDGVANKYSKAYLNLKAVMDLEEQEKYKMSKSLKDDFINIKEKYISFLEEIPLAIIEKYFYMNLDDLNKFIYISYKEKEIYSISVIELYMELEEFYNEIFKLGSLIANFYNIEIKINKNATDSGEESEDFV